MEQTVDENQYQAHNPKAASPSKVPAGSAERKWQLISLLTGILFVMAAAIVVWLALDISAAGTLQSKLESENQSLREQTSMAGSQITELKSAMETLLNRNTELTTENAKLKSQNISPAASRYASASRQSGPVDASRIEAMRKGTFSSGATKAELVEAIGEPDRIYNARGYEQLVYFGKKPGRFWLVDERVVQVGG